MEPREISHWVPWNVMERAGSSRALCGPHLCAELQHLDLTFVSAVEFTSIQRWSSPPGAAAGLGFGCYSGVAAARGAAGYMVGSRKEAQGGSGGGFTGCNF